MALDRSAAGVEVESLPLANSPTFAAWHQDATYFGIEPYEHVTAWVALSDATEEAGCMEVVPSRARPQQMHHAALGLKDKRPSRKRPQSSTKVCQRRSGTSPGG